MHHTTDTTNARVGQGFLFILLLGAALALPPLRAWPWIWLGPLGAYFLILALVPRWRRVPGWLRVGTLSPRTLAATAGVMVASMATLVCFHHLAQPDVRTIRAAMPVQALGGAMLTGVVFTLLNALMEELVFRGILFDALEAQWGWRLTLVVTSLLFGLGHLRGYPPGPAGAVLAAVFGLAMGGLRVWTRGLALPVAAHLGADATICYLVLRGPGV